MNDNQKPGSLVERYAQRAKAESGQSPSNDAVRDHVCHTEHPIALAMIDLHLADGRRMGLPYHYLEFITFDQNRIIDMRFAHHNVRIVGLGLEPVYKILLGHRVGRLSIVPRGKFEDSGPEPVVTGISVESRDVEES